MGHWKILGVVVGVAAVALVLSQVLHFGYVDEDERAAATAIDEFHDRLRNAGPATESFLFARYGRSLQLVRYEVHDSHGSPASETPQE